MTKHALLVLLSGLAAACGASDNDPLPVATPEPVAPAPPPAAVEPAPPALDHGAPSEKYPAFDPAMGQLAQNGGSVLKNPVIVTVTWPGDDKADQLEALGDSLGTGQYWKDITSEYGVGAAVSGAANHVRLTEPAAASMSDKELDAFVVANLTKAEAAWPHAAADTVYVLYLPSTTDLILQGKSACSQGVGGYHDSTKVNLKSVPYAIVPRCGSFDTITVSASHELGEAATDPYPSSRPAWSGFKEESLAWDFFQQFQSENADACEFYRDSPLTPGETDVPFTVVRQWSNASAKAGHDPCVPAIKNTKYFNVTPLDLEDLDVDLSALGGDVAKTKGFKVKVGDTRQIPLGFYSDGPLSAWTIEAKTGGIASHGRSSGAVDVTLDTTQGQNGEKAYLTVTVNTASKQGAELITIVSSRAGTTHYMPILLGRP